MAVFLDANFYEGENSPWVRLLNLYQGIMDFEAAYAHFEGNYDTVQEAFLDADGQPATFQKLVQVGSKDKVDNPGVAVALLGPPPGTLSGTQTGQQQGTYFRATYTAFKSIGLVTGINVRWLDELKIEPSEDENAVQPTEEMKQLSKKLTGEYWSPGVEQEEVPSHPGVAKGVYVGLSNPYLTVDSTGTLFQKYDKDVLYFMSPSILRFLVRKGVYIKEKGSVTFDDNPYLQLAYELYQMLGKNAVRSLGPDEKRWPGYLRTADALKHPALSAAAIEHWDDEDNAALKAFLISPNETLRDDEGGNLQPWEVWPKSTSTSVTDTTKYTTPGISKQSTALVLDMWNGATIADKSDAAQWRYRMFAIGSGTTVDGEPTSESMRGDINAPYTGWATSTSRMFRIHALIKQLIEKDLRPHLAAIEDVDTVDLALDKRRHSRIQDILGFFGHGDRKNLSVTEAGQNITAAEEAGVLDRISPAKRNLAPIDYQCFLLEQIRNVAAAHRPDYKNVIRLDSNKQPGLVQNKLANTMSYGAVQQLLSICPNIQALLTPYLKVSRVTYDDQGKATGKEIDLEIPNFLTPTDVSKITERGRLPGAGIKSFTWSLDGVQPAEVDNNISATLELYFQSVQDFFDAPAAGRPGKASYLDLVIASPSTIRKQGAEPGVPNSAACTRKTDEMLARQWRGDNYRIKVVAGWSTPDVTALRRAMPEGGGRYAPLHLYNALENSKITLFLQQTRHNFKFNEDGSLLLTVDYQAALSGMATAPSADIFGASSEAQMKSLKAAELAVEEEKAKGEETEEQKENIKAKLEEVKRLRGQDKMIKYKKLLSHIFKSNKIYNMPISPKELLLPPYSELTPEGRARRAKRRAAESLTTFVGGNPQNAQLLQAVSSAASGETTAEEASENFSVGLQEDYDGMIQNADIIWLSYFYLGDLLDAVLDQVKLNHDLEEIPFKFFLSDVEMIDPLVALKIKNLEDVIKCKQDFRDAAFMDALIALKGDEFTQEAGITQLMNIGDIPIAIDAFQVWFKDYVIKKDRDKYFFLHFVKDICAELITRALAGKCFGPDVKISQRFDTQPITFKMGPKGRANLKSTKVVSAWSPTSNPTKYSLVESIRALKSTTPANETELAMVLMSTDSKPKGLVGNYKHDTELGIYHQYLGSPCGLLKTMNFNREDQAYLREVKIQKEGALGPEQLRELYSAEIELYGNTLFKNGSYIYLDPKLMGSTPKQLRILGLHGYYLITGVSSTVTENSFDVSVSALHEGVAFREEVLMAPETYTDLTPDNAPYMSPTERDALAQASVDEGEVPGGGTGVDEILDTDSGRDEYGVTEERLNRLVQEGLSEDRAAFERRRRQYNQDRSTNQRASGDPQQAAWDYVGAVAQDPYVIQQGGLSNIPDLPALTGD